MKIEIDLPDELAEIVDDFKIIAGRVLRENETLTADEIANLEEKGKYDVAVAVLVRAGLDHFRDKIMARISPTDIIQELSRKEMGEANKPLKPRSAAMVIGPGGVEISGDLPQPLRELLESVGQTMQENLLDLVSGDNECDCENCRARRFQPEKGRPS